MERGPAKLVLLAVMVALLAAEAEVGAEAAYALCNTDVNVLKPCMPAVTQPPSDPVAGCCQVLKQPSMNLTCFCQFGQEHPYVLQALGIDPDLAKALPSKCSIPSPTGCA